MQLITILKNSLLGILATAILAISGFLATAVWNNNGSIKSLESKLEKYQLPLR